MSPIPGGPGNPPPKKHKHPPPVTGHGHGHKSQSASGDPHPGGQHGGGVTGGHNNPGGTNPPGGTYHAPAWVIRRQQVLRRAGFNIAVDGVWGSASQAAWASFNRRINPAQHTVQQAIATAQHQLPPGMVRLPNGKVVPEQVARQMHVVTMAQQHAAKAKYAPGQLAAMQRIAARTGHSGGVAFQKQLAQQNHTAPPLTKRQARQQAIAQQKADVNEALGRIVGPDNLRHGKGLLLAPAILRDRASKGFVNAHDLALLMRHGYIDPRNSDDVKTIQQVIDHHLPKGQAVHVNGTYDISTDAALKKLFARTAARDFKAQVEHTRKQLFATGVAQAATLNVLGHKITDPATLLRILQRGGPDAVRLTEALSRGYEHHQEDLVLKRIKDIRAKALGGTSPLDKVFGSPFSNDFLLAGSSNPVDKLLLKSGSLNEFRTLTDAYLRHAELKQLRESMKAKSQPSWWQEGVSTVGSALSWPGDKARGAMLAFQYWETGVNNSFANWVHDKTGLDTSWGLTGIDSNGDPLPKLFAGTNGKDQWRDVRSPDGYVSWHRAWHEGQITLSDMPWGERLAFELIADPLNFVGVGEAGIVVRGGFGLAARASLRGVDILDKVAPVLAPELHAIIREADLRAYEVFAHVSQTGLVVPIKGWMGAKILGEETRRARYWGIATSARADAIDRVNAAIRESFVTSLRDITVGRIAGKVESRISALGAHADAIARLVDPAVMGELNSATSAARDLLSEIAPELHKALLDIPTSLYAKYGRDGAELSLAGRRIHGFFSEYASRAILTRYVILRRLATDPADVGTLSKMSVEQLRVVAQNQLGDAEYRKLLDEAGSWYAGHPPLDLREAYFNELRIFTDRLEHQLLPGLDELMRLKHGESIWAKLGDVPLGLLHEGGAAVRDALDNFFGYSVEDAFDPANYEKVKNPNFGVEVSDAEHLTLETDEIERSVRSFDGWVEMKRRIDGAAISADVLEARHLAIRDAVEAAWEHLPNGKWRDTRRFLKVPAPLARSIDLTALSGAHREGALLADLLTGLDRVPGFDSAAAGTAVQAGEDALNRVLGNDAWQRFATVTDRQDALHAIAEGQIATGLYKANGLVLDFLHTHQSWYVRRIYNVLTLGLAGWKTATLPFRPAFYVRNVIDNYTKAFLSGLRDPRAFFNPEGKSIFEMTAYRAMHAGARYYDTIFGTDVAGFLDHLENLFWQQPDSTISKLFGVYDIEVPKELYAFKRTSAGLSDTELVTQAPHLNHVTGGAIRRASTSTKDWKDRWTSRMWDWMAARPENLAKRQLYNNLYRNGIRDGLTTGEAAKAALEKVEFTLFDYEKVTVLEEQLKVLAPFIFFWRKNATFWASTAAQKPWFFLAANKLYQGHEQTNSDMPDWMRRYVNLAPVASITDQYPGLGWVSNWLRDGSNFDPLNYVSFVQFYRAFKDASNKENPLLPADRQGSWGFVAALVDGLNSVGGLGINPFLSEAGQRLGVLNRWSWRDIYPQTTLIQAITSTDWMRNILHTVSFGHVDEAGGPTGFNVEDFLLDPLFKDILQVDQPTGSQLGLDRFNQFVQQEMAGQVLRGEPADRAKAEAKIRGFIAFQTLMGFAIGIFPRRISNEDLALYQLIELRHQLTVQGNDSELISSWYNLSPQEQEAYKLFKARGYDPAAFDRYRHGLDAARVFFEIEDPQAQQQWLQDHPEALPIVNPIAGGRVPSDEYLKTQILLARQDAVFAFGETYLKGIDAAPDVKAAAYDTLVTPSLRAFWAKNDTTYEQQQRQIRGSYFKYISGVQETYFNIPSTDYQAKQDYLNRHPELQDWWAQNDGATDDYRNVMQYVNATFRTIYFHHVDQGDWNTADEFLRRHPFIFDFTSAEGRIDPEGKWIPKSEQQRDYAKAAPDLRAYYALPEKLRDDYARAHPLVNWFLTKYGAAGTPMKPGYTSYAPGGLTQHGKDYLAVAKQLDAYFALSTPAEKARFLESHPEVKAYFAKYAQSSTMSQHARDYLAVKGVLDQFFALPQSERSAFLKRHPELSAYFSKYSSGKNGHSGQSYEEATRRALAEHPDIAQRYHFWMQLFALPPNQRAAFVHNHAADAGIFIYGSLSYDARQLQQQRWHRQAIRLGESDKHFLYDRVAPLLDIYFSLPAGGGERTLFLQTNPDLQLYLDKYAGDGSSPTGNPHLDKLLQAYFLIPGFDPRRNQFLSDHPELAVYFNKDATPKEKALQNAVDGYFQLPYGSYWRVEYLAKHPEVKKYFDQRKHEHDLFNSLSAAFNANDPRMVEFTKMYEDIIPLDAMHLWFLAQHGKHEIVQAPSRDQTGRQPEKPSTSTSIKKAGSLQTRRDRNGTSPPATT